MISAEVSPTGGKENSPKPFERSAWKTATTESPELKTLEQRILEAQEARKTQLTQEFAGVEAPSEDSSKASIENPWSDLKGDVFAADAVKDVIHSLGGGKKLPEITEKIKAKREKRKEKRVFIPIQEEPAKVEYDDFGFEIDANEVIHPRASVDLEEGYLYKNGRMILAKEHELLKQRTAEKEKKAGSIRKLLSYLEASFAPLKNLWRTGTVTEKYEEAPKTEKALTDFDLLLQQQEFQDRAQTDLDWSRRVATARIAYFDKNMGPEQAKRILLGQDVRRNVGVS